MAEIKKLTILHSNDMHGDFMAETVDEKLVGGVAMLSGYINKVRSEEPNCLYCVAGDMFRGSIIDSEFQGLSTIEIMNMLSPDVVTLGNHETDYGLSHLLFIEKCARFPIINANLHIKTNGARLFKPYQVIEIDGMKILFIGILTEEVIAQTRNEKLIGSIINVEDAVKEVGKICNAHHTTDIDLTVLLTHIGYEEDLKLAAQLDPSWGVDIIIGGHSHTFIDKPAEVNNILIAQAGTGTDQVGRFDININTDTNSVDSYTWKSIPINPDNCPVNKELEELIHTYKTTTDSKYRCVITRFNEPLTHPCRTMETPLGDVLSDALKECLGVDVMLLASGSIRMKSLGPVVHRDSFMECFPYDDAIFMLRATGDQLRRMLLFMVRDEVWEGAHCEFYQLSQGMRVVYNKATHSFEEFSFNGRPIEDDDILSIGLQLYHFENFDSVFGFSRKELEKNRRPRKLSTSSTEVLEEYFAENPIIHPHQGGRLIIKEG